MVRPWWWSERVQQRLWRIPGPVESTPKTVNMMRQRKLHFWSHCPDKGVFFSPRVSSQERWSKGRAFRCDEIPGFRATDGYRSGCAACYGYERSSEQRTLIHAGRPHGRADGDGMCTRNKDALTCVGACVYVYSRTDEHTARAKLAATDYGALYGTRNVDSVLFPTERRWRRRQRRRRPHAHDGLVMCTIGWFQLSMVTG